MLLSEGTYCSCHYYESEGGLELECDDILGDT